MQIDGPVSPRTSRRGSPKFGERLSKFSGGSSPGGRGGGSPGGRGSPAGRGSPSKGGSPSSRFAGALASPNNNSQNLQRTATDYHAARGGDFDGIVVKTQKKSFSSCKYLN
jgi:hypothetical protein